MFLVLRSEKKTKKLAVCFANILHNKRVYAFISNRMPSFVCENRTLFFFCFGMILSFGVFLEEVIAPRSVDFKARLKNPNFCVLLMNN